MFLGEIREWFEKLLSSLYISDLAIMHIMTENCHSTPVCTCKSIQMLFFFLFFFWTWDSPNHNHMQLHNTDSTIWTSPLTKKTRHHPYITPSCFMYRLSASLVKAFSLRLLIFRDNSVDVAIFGYRNSLGKMLKWIQY